MKSAAVSFLHSGKPQGRTDPIYRGGLGRSDAPEKLLWSGESGAFSIFTLQTDYTLGKQGFLELTRG